MILSSIRSQLHRHHHPLLPQTRPFPFFATTRQVSLTVPISQLGKLRSSVGKALGPGWLFLPPEQLRKLAARAESSGGARAAQPVSRNGGWGCALRRSPPGRHPCPRIRAPWGTLPRASQPLPPPTTPAARAAHSRAPWFSGRPAGRLRALSPACAPVPRVSLARPRGAARTPAVPPGSQPRTSASRPTRHSRPAAAAAPPSAPARSARVPPGRAPTHRLPVRPTPEPDPWAAPAAPAASRGADRKSTRLNSSH